MQKNVGPRKIGYYVEIIQIKLLTLERSTLQISYIKPIAIFSNIFFGLNFDFLGKFDEHYCILKTVFQTKIQFKNFIIVSYHKKKI